MSHSTVTASSGSKFPSVIVLGKNESVKMSLEASILKFGELALCATSLTGSWFIEASTDKMLWTILDKATNQFNHSSISVTSRSHLDFLKEYFRLCTDSTAAMSFPR